MFGFKSMWQTAYHFVAGLTTVSATGSYTYNIPAKCRFVDVVLIGAGAGGDGGGWGAPGAGGSGGGAGSWQTVTLRRGVDIPWSTTQITGTIPTGGAAGGGGGGYAPNASATTATAAGWAGLSAAGGLHSQAGFPNAVNTSPTTFNGRTYTGGSGGVPTGNTPGGGGAGGSNNFGGGVAGYNGGAGRAWFYAY